MKRVIIVQARMGSIRAPGKVLKQVQGKALLQHQLERLLQVSLADELVVATSRLPQDTPICQLCTQLQVPFYRGSEEDVLSRFYEAAQAFDADLIVRIGGDCPLIDPEIVDQVLQYYLEAQEHYDYVSNVLLRSFPREWIPKFFPLRS